MKHLVFEFPDARKASTFAAVVSAMDLGHTAKASHRVVDVTMAPYAEPWLLRGARDLLVLAADCHGGTKMAEPEEVLS